MTTTRFLPEDGVLFHVEVAFRPGLTNPACTSILSELRAFGLDGLRSVDAVDLFLLEGDLTEPDVERVARELLADPILQIWTVGRPVRPETESAIAAGGPVRAVTIFRKPGVMDPVEASALRAIAGLGLKADRLRTGRKLFLTGPLDDATLRRAVVKVLANEAVDEVHHAAHVPDCIPSGQPYRFARKEIPLQAAGPEELDRISRTGGLSLSRAEMEAIQRHFRALKREPTDVELETIAQTWSEHCKHKTFASEIAYTEKTPGTAPRPERIANLLRETIVAATRALNRPWCLSVFRDNAGVIDFDGTHAVCFKVETHNHPSAIEPYGGSNTGLGGVIRDVLGCGLGAKPIAGTDVFCVGAPDTPDTTLPPGTIPPARLLRGVVSGVRDYGNRMGIPTVNGAVCFDPRYIGNPLVFCGTIGVMPHTALEKAARPGDLIVVLGGRTGRDGIHGATFSSAQLTSESETVSSGAVQIGNAIVEKRVLDALLQARDQGLYTAVTDCGAGGLSSAVGEMGETIGAEVDLERVPLKYEGLSYCEIWISEAQERMVLAVPPDRLDALAAICAAEDVELSVIGRFGTPDATLRLRYAGTPVGELDMEFLHHGVPRIVRQAVWEPPTLSDPSIPEPPDAGPLLRRLLGAWNTASKAWIIRQYDHEVQGGSVIKPLVGSREDGPGDGAVVAPLLGHPSAVAVACGINTRYGDIDPYAMAAAAIDEAVRNAVCVGADPDRIAILDNFAWGNPEHPDILGALVRAAKACRDVAVAYGTPFISGKDSLYNEFAAGDRRINIPHTLLISAIGLVRDARRSMTMDFKTAGHAVVLVGLTKPELGGSEYLAIHGALGRAVPRLDPAAGRRAAGLVAGAIARGLVRAAHDCSEGGLAVALAEMAFAGGVGASIRLDGVPVSPDVRRDDEILFSESLARYLLEVPPENRSALAALFGTAVPWGVIGETTAAPCLEIKGRNGARVVREPLEALKEAWQKPLAW